jgi:hypothetical protein
MHPEDAADCWKLTERTQTTQPPFGHISRAHIVRKTKKRRKAQQSRTISGRNSTALHYGRSAWSLSVQPMNPKTTIGAIKLVALNERRAWATRSTATRIAKIVLAGHTRQALHFVSTASRHCPSSGRRHKRIECQIIQRRQECLKH